VRRPGVCRLRPASAGTGAVSLRGRPRPSLLVTLALATLGAACPSSNGPAPDASGGSGGGGAGGRGGSAGTDGAVTGGSSGRGGTGGSGGSGRQDAGSPGGRDSAGPRDAPGRDSPVGPDVVDARSSDLRPDAGASADAGVNPRQLWFSGPESDLHLSDIEPQVPF
jgi:hypothetical protein